MSATSSPATALGANHGYRFAGDSVHLNAEVTLAASDLQDGSTWSLQLWASGAGFAERAPAGVKVGEFPLQPLPGCFNVDACVAALPPAGHDAFTMALMLVSGDTDGGVEVRDLAIYPTPQYFVQPTLGGALDCRIADGLAEIVIESIANPRAADNLSGTLALEVWALDSPYAGGAWTGTPVASLVLGQLAGGEAWSDCRYTVPAVDPAGAALTVMLREWTASGYLTRDYRNLPLVAAVASAAVAPAPTASPAKPAAKKAAKAPAVAAQAATVSVNAASVEELAALKGLSRAVAAAIVAGRPYASVAELLRVKGLGPKLLEKLGASLRV
ncbi:ComEA family DNA-binding protein [Azonexus caeni]|uniref:ComEA family DNA-binding protein n=1 Tax=Azonexus caeni TaxID=266126 RepID=UPI002C4471FC|nr:helix-hairpin-helix domain-containing protein [Azonexus sp.]